MNAMFVEVLKKWLSGAGGECTKEKLVEVLRSDCCREKKLAAKIEGDNGMYIHVLTCVPLFCVHAQ